MQNVFSLFSITFLQYDLLFPGSEQSWKANALSSRAPNGGSRGGWGDINACAACMLKCKCPLLWVSGTLIIMRQRVRSDFDRIRSNGFIFFKPFNY